MAIIALDIGGTKIAGGLFSGNGNLLNSLIDSISGQEGKEIGQTILYQVQTLAQSAKTQGETVDGIGASVPGIYNPDAQTVWAPNLPGWDAYPLAEEIRRSFKEDIPVSIDSDRSCYILGEMWKGKARGCMNAIFIAVGTGIGAGILVNGQVVRGIGNSAGAIGWMALDRPHYPEYSKYGCFEYHASGAGLVRMANKYLSENPDYKGVLLKDPEKEITTMDIFTAYKEEDPIALRVINEAIEFWGMAVANLVSIFNPEKILFGGGVFNTAPPFLGQIKTAAKRWAQPIGIEEVSIDIARLGTDAGLYGAGYLALLSLNQNSNI